MRMDTETGGIHPHPKKGPGLLATTRNKEQCLNRFSPTASGRNERHHHLDCRLLASWTMRQSISITLSHPVYGNPLWQPRKLIQAIGSVLKQEALSRGEAWYFYIHRGSRHILGGHTNPESAPQIPQKTVWIFLAVNFTNRDGVK